MTLKGTMQHQVKALDLGTLELSGVVTFGASGAIASQSCKGFTVSKPTGTGLYRITLDDAARALLGIQLTPYVGATPVGSAWQLKTELTSYLTIDLHHVAWDDTAGTTGSPAAADATSGHKLYIRLQVRLTTVGD